MLVAPGVWFLLVLSLLLALALRYSLLGRYLYAVGSNEATARLCGISVPRVKLAVYGLAGLATGLAGVMQFLQLTVGDPTTADGLEFQVIAAVVIGGGSLSGGEGTVLGTLIGCLIIVRPECRLHPRRHPQRDPGRPDRRDHHRRRRPWTVSAGVPPEPDCFPGAAPCRNANSRRSRVSPSASSGRPGG